MGPFGITRNKLDLGWMVACVKDPRSGAVVTFLGVSRETSLDKRNVERPVKTLYYEAYDVMAIKKLREIAKTAQEEYGALHVSAWHRKGEVRVGEVSVAIAVSAPHRPEAYAACRYVIDEIKRSVPIWKRECFEDGEEWVEGFVADPRSASPTRANPGSGGPADV